MNTGKTSSAVGDGAEPRHLYTHANQGLDAERPARISSRKPQMVVVLATMIAAISLGAATKQLLASNHVPWTLLTLGIGHLLVSLAGFAMWKHVHSDAEHYVVSDFIKSERIPFENVCMVVQTRGLIWKSIRIHFRRPTRFGRSVSYVPVVPTGSSATLVAKSEESAHQSGIR